MKKLIIPEEITITTSTNEIQVKGTEGTLTLKIPSSVKITQEDDSLLVQGKSVKDQALVGTINSLIINMIEGVKKDGGYKKILEVKGAGYRVEEKKQGDKQSLEFSLGYSHQIKLEIPSHLRVKCLKNKIDI